MLPNALGIGNYRIEEVAAPYGYVLNENYVEVAVDTNTMYEIDPDTNDAIITVEYENAPAVGKIVVEKFGEVLVGFKGGLFAQSHEKDFVYEERGLAGAEFEVYAAEDIYTADMQVDADGNRTRYYAKGDLVATLVTGEDGMATLSDLPLGTYKVVETKAPNGYVLNAKAHIVKLEYKDDRTPVIESKVSVGNDRQKLELTIMKKDASTKKVLEGAVFGLYADKDIYNADGKLIVEAGTLIEKAVSDKNGLVAFKKDYPFSVYSVKELQAPDGYLLTDETVVFETAYQGQDKEKAEYSSEVFNTAKEMPKGPKTGDASNTGLWIGIGAGSLLGIGLFMLIKRKRKEV